MLVCPELYAWSSQDVLVVQRIVQVDPHPPDSNASQNAIKSKLAANKVKSKPPSDHARSPFFTGTRREHQSKRNMRTGT